MSTIFISDGEVVAPKEAPAAPSKFEKVSFVSWAFARGLGISVVGAGFSANV